MSRKDYIALAKLIAETKFLDDAKKSFFVAELSNILKRDNPNFNRLKFINACFPTE